MLPRDQSSPPLGTGGGRPQTRELEPERTRAGPSPSGSGASPGARPVDPSLMTTSASSPLAALHLLVSMLGEGEIASPDASFYDRLAEAVCRLGSMRRAAVFLSDDVRRRVWAVGSHGIDLDLLADGPVQAIPLAL